MADNYAEYRGEQGESHVRGVIQLEIGPDDRALHDLLLVTSRDKTTQIDHIVIDRFGILIVETKNIGGLLRGKSGERQWTVCYPDGNKRQMFSPLEQNELHRKRLHQFLLAQGMELRDNYVQSLIVFADGNIEALELSAEDSARVTDLNGLRQFLRTRSDFQPNEGALTPPVVEGFAETIKALDRSDDAELKARHVAQAQSAKQGRGGARRPGSQRAGSRPASRPSTQPVTAGGIAEVFAQALRGFAIDLVRIAAGILAVMLLVTVGLPLFAKAFTVALTASANSMKNSATATPAPVTTPDPAIAFQRLREADPEIADAITNPDSPDIGSERGLTTYTWEYLKKTGKGSVDVKTISIALDANGMIVGSP